uniref:Aquaporin 10a n=1 Tax=Scleropages formosus TaxID=113540 RepID=A0A8C9W4I5_SCLFO
MTLVIFLIMNMCMFGCAASAQVKTSRETKGEFLSVAMAFCVGLMSAMYLCGGVSGAHLNPAVSLSFCIIGRLSWKKLLPYSISQVLGAYLGSAVAFLLYYDAIMDYNQGKLTVTGPNETASIFVTYPSEYLSLQGSFLDQVIGTATLLLCILPLDEKRNNPAPAGLLPVIVAAVVLGISLSMSSNCGAAINPARDFGPRLFTLTAGWGTEVFTCVCFLVHPQWDFPHTLAEAACPEWGHGEPEPNPATQGVRLEGEGTHPGRDASASQGTPSGTRTPGPPECRTWPNPLHNGSTFCTF